MLLNTVSPRAGRLFRLRTIAALLKIDARGTGTISFQRAI